MTTKELLDETVTVYTCEPIGRKLRQCQTELPDETNISTFRTLESELLDKTNTQWSMPPRRRNKLKSISGQPSVLSLVSESHNTTTPSKINTQQNKARTPPTPPNPEDSESNPNKRLNMSVTDTQEDDLLGELTPELKKIDLLIKRNLQPINNSIKSLLETAKTTAMHQVEINSLKENNFLKHKCQKLEKEQKNIKERLDKMENMQLDNNLILHGIPEPTAWEYPETRYAKVIENLASTMNGQTEAEQRDMARNLSIQKTKPMGKFTMEKSRPISITFRKYEDVEYLLTYKRYLPRGIYLDKEYCEEIEKRRKLLRPIMRCAKKHDNFKKKCRMDGDTLVIRGKQYTVNNLHQLPAEINGFEATTKKDNGVTCFFGELNPMSNFHPTKIHHDGHIYHSSEQLIQHKKSQLFGDAIAEAQILATSTAIESKMEGRNIRNYDQQQWESSAKALCYEGIKAKFTQNPWLSNLLLSTNDETLAEATFDKVWGTGVPLHRRDCTDRTQWHGIGIMGEILMAVRKDLKPAPTATTAEQPMDSACTTPSTNPDSEGAHD